MASLKINLPANGTSASSHDGDPKIFLEQIKADTARDKGRLDIIKEAIGVVNSIFGVIKSYQELQGKRAEWVGRVDVARSELAKAELDLEKELQTTVQHLASLQSINRTQEKLLGFFDQLMAELTSDQVSEQVRRDTRQELLKLSEQLVKLSK
ncbi:hypothetical protein [Variovorax sp. PAMC26660]|uniref:hypothetical protein n=1 Tax=Variovorax sp. PAMC26660 TaxID=2762322 RepID=UPI00164DD5FF|nr:hypothetical protein [Variovorax sp. PAMC26660]QNK68555.1 hypothetical protein H7F35_02080 [Variovorax sp. PAMC26660]